MLKMAELTGLELKWIQPNALKMEYELRAGDSVAAALRFRSSFGSFATAESADGSWAFKRAGFWKTKVTIRTVGRDEDLAIYRKNTWDSGGTLELPDGRTYRANTNFWMTQFEFRNEMGEALVSYTKIGGILHMSSKLKIPAQSAEINHMPWIIGLGWYLAVMMHRDSAAAAAA